MLTLNVPDWLVYTAIALAVVYVLFGNYLFIRNCREAGPPWLIAGPNPTLGVAIRMTVVAYLAVVALWLPLIVCVKWLGDRDD